MAQTVFTDGSSSGHDRKRQHQESSRLKEGRESKAFVAEARAEKKKKADDRRQQRAQDEEESMLVEQDCESTREARLRRAATAMQVQNDVYRAENDSLQAEIAQLKARVHHQATAVAAATSSSSYAASTLAAAPVTVGVPVAATVAAASAPVYPTPVAPAPIIHAPIAPAPIAPIAPAPVAITPEPDSIGAPENKSHLNIKRVRTLMGLGSPQHDDQWHEYRTVIYDMSALAQFNYKTSWKHQDKAKVIALCNMAREHIPPLQWFKENWVAEYLVQDAFNHRRSHIQRKAKIARQQASNATAPEDNGPLPPPAGNGLVLIPAISPSPSPTPTPTPSPSPSLSPYSSPTPPPTSMNIAGPSNNAGNTVASTEGAHLLDSNVPAQGDANGAPVRGGHGGRGGRGGRGGCGGHGGCGKRGGRGGRGGGRPVPPPLMSLRSHKVTASPKGKGKAAEQSESDESDNEYDAFGMPTSGLMECDAA
ncbi:hypothetical protein FS749_000324, partial [Ceratobasidium sp. UAMH 11750]